MAQPCVPESGQNPRRQGLDPEAEREALLDAGLRVLARSGYDRAGVDEVLMEAGLGTRAFYRQFASKDELLCGIFRRDALSAIRQVKVRVAGASTPVEGLEAWLDEVFSIRLDPRRAQRAGLLGSRGARSAAGWERERELAAAGFIEPLAAVLEAGRKDGTFNNVEPELDARLIHTIAWATVEGTLGGSSQSEMDRLRQHIQRFTVAALTNAVTETV